MKLSSIFGLKTRWRRVRILAGEGALAAEDRALLLKLAWEDEKHRLRRMLALGTAVVGLTTVAIALLSVAVIVHFWDTPHRVTAAWVLALVWTALWAVAVTMLLGTLHKTSGFAAARQTFERDLAWFRARFGPVDEEGAPLPTPAQLGTDELIARIDRQRQRIDTLQAAASGEGEAPLPKESISDTGLRLAREHPIATGVVTAAVIAVVGPRRVTRWATIIAPIIWRLRG
ncbi:phage holin family protein [Variovorax sp. J22P168]|uniref:phage holin family protein n=1 Tax=Variovorax jilinensis TaxID=3053513 RepID=UPI0025785AA8|nr:phage holin family protein [Variovorax sp. J22P168]MDM0013658.1 phage holin family protein [Variovorax sp. J22P168]